MLYLLIYRVFDCQVCLVVSFVACFRLRFQVFFVCHFSSFFFFGFQFCKLRRSHLVSVTSCAAAAVWPCLFSDNNMLPVCLPGSQLGSTCLCDQVVSCSPPVRWVGLNTAWVALPRLFVLRFRKLIWVIIKFEQLYPVSPARQKGKKVGVKSFRGAGLAGFQRNPKKMQVRSDW